MRIAALTDLKNTPSSRFRIRGHISKLYALGIHVTDCSRKYSTELSGAFYPDKNIKTSPIKAVVAGFYHALDIMDTGRRCLTANKYDAIWVSRQIINGHPSFERLLKKPMIYDIDDAVFMGNKKLRSGVDYLIRNSACIFAGNTYLHDYCSQYNKNSLVIPTAVDTTKFFPKNHRPSDEKFVVVWSGTSSSYVCFRAAQDALFKFFNSKKDAVLKICSDRYPAELDRLHPFIEYVAWDESNEATEIQNATVGLMPIHRDSWALGKCSYKMLLYMACGIPCIVTDFGMNSELLKSGDVGIGVNANSDWSDALFHMYENRDNLNNLYPDGLHIINSKYSCEKVVESIRDGIRRYACNA